MTMTASKKIGLPLLILAMGGIYVFLVPLDPEPVRLLFKLIPLWLILLYAYLRAPSGKKSHELYLLAGLFFCMLGDGLLGMFVVGLSAFLVGHLFFRKLRRPMSRIPER